MMSASVAVSEPPGPSPAGRMFRLSAVPGSEPNRSNDLLLLLCGDVPDTGQHVVFFPGDIQNFQQDMVLHSEGVQWQKWSFERVALTLSRRFPGHHVWVVRPSHMYLHKFSSYGNFVASSVLGAPEHCVDGGAVRQLGSLLRHGMERAGLLSTATPFPPPTFSVVLVGFSKGCVVLNQLVYELAWALEDPELSRFLHCIAYLYWLDGGHPGGGGTWVTEREALQALTSLGAVLYAHVTPYEVRDPTRPWVGCEHHRFVQTLQELGARITSAIHFEDEAPSIDNHFRIIEEF